MKVLKKIKVFAVLSALTALLATGCSNELDDSKSFALMNNSKYGTIVIDSTARFIDVNEINKASVTVSGSGMTDISKTGISVSSGKGTIKIEKIPVGKNRVIKIQAYKDGTVVAGKALYKVSDIVAGVNNIVVDSASSAEGKAYAALLSAGVDISKVASISGMSSVTKAELFDADSFANAYKSNASVSAASYIKKASNVTFQASEANGYTVWVDDPLSSKVSVTSDGNYTVEGVAPGTWNVYVDNGSGISVKGIVSVAGDGQTVDSNLTVGSVVFKGIQVQVSKKDNSAFDSIHYFDCSDKSKYPNTKWPGVKMLTDWSDDYYIYNFENVTQVSILITAGETKLCSKDMILKASESNAFRITSSGAVKSEYIEKKFALPVITASYSSGKVVLSTNVDVVSASITVSAGSESVSVTSLVNGKAEVDVFSWDLSDGTTITCSGTINGTPVSDTCVYSVSTDIKIYVSSTSGAPKLWLWQSGNNISQLMGESHPGTALEAAKGLNCNDNWYVKVIPEDLIKTGSIKFQLNGGKDSDFGKATTLWYDADGLCGAAGTIYDADPTVKPEPVKPTLKLSPADGKEIGTVASIKIEANFGYDEVTANEVTINGKKFTLSEGSNTFAVSDFATTAGVTITVSATLTNSKGTATASATYTTKLLKEDPFTWDNVNAYFVLTDRFYNGDTKNDHSYYRQNAETSSSLDSGYNNVATFHGGDIKGLTEKLDYLDNLGVNAIWITAPYEQAHGWCTGGGNGFAHYAFHGYYTQDWTYMDQNMGTIEEFRTFVNEAHKRGIRIVMDVVMNHTGYNTVEDMITYDFGNFNNVPTHGWLGDGSWSDNHTITIYNEAGNWGNWWSGWIRAFGDQTWGTAAGFEKDGGGDLRGSLAGLPDVLSEKTTSVAIPQFLKTKWKNEPDSTTVPSATGNTCGYKYGDYKLATVGNADWNGKTGDWRADNMGAPADYQVMWLSAWVREFGIDGFRCDTAKHIDMYRWGQLKVACQSALEAWRNDSSKSDPAGAKEWDESFWMTGECFGWTSTNGQGDYYSTGKFDSMINFSIGGGNHWEQSGYAYHTPNIKEDTWGTYLSINSNADSDGNGNRNNVLTYISSHDTRLSRTGDQVALGTMFTLLPGGIQIYYGDESYREKDYTECGDGDMPTRTDMNWADISGSKASMVAHWGKVGKFRKYNPAVGAGTGTATKRTYSGPAGENKVAISISGTTVDVNGLFADGTTVYNWYDGTSAKVSGGKVTFAGGTTAQPILVSDKDPARF